MEDVGSHNIPLFPVRWPCGAKTRKGTPCKNWAMKNRTRCRLHGGLAFGPKTDEGRVRIGQAHYKHGKYNSRIAKRRLLLKAIKHYELERHVACPRMLIDYWWNELQKMPWSQFVKERAYLTEKYRVLKKTTRGSNKILHSR